MQSKRRADLADSCRIEREATGFAAHSVSAEQFCHLGSKGSGERVVYLTMEKLAGLIELSLTLSCIPAGNSRRGLLMPDVSTTTLMSSRRNCVKADGGPDNVTFATRGRTSAPPADCTRTSLKTFSTDRSPISTCTSTSASLTSTFWSGMSIAV